MVWGIGIGTLAIEPLGGGHMMAELLGSINVDAVSTLGSAVENLSMPRATSSGPLRCWPGGAC